MIPSLRSGLGVVTGYLTMVVLITLVQETWFGGVTFGESSRSVLIVAGAFTFGAAIVGGMAGVAVTGAASRVPGLVMSVLVVLETIYLVTTGRIGDPLWFDVLASASLVVGILLGAEYLARRRKSASAPVPIQTG